jgi:hypothetical protein
MQPGLPTQAGSAIAFAPVQRPEKSGRPPGAFGAGAFRLTVPFGSLGTPAVGYLIHCAAAAAVIDIVKRATQSARMDTKITI